MVTVKEHVDFGAAIDLPCITFGDVEKDDYLKTLKSYLLLLKFEVTKFRIIINFN